MAVSSQRTSVILGFAVVWLVLVGLSLRALIERPEWLNHTRLYTPTQVDASRQHRLDDTARPSHPKPCSAPSGLPATDTLPYRPYDPICEAFPDTSRLMVVVKSGASVTHERLPTLLMTLLKCLPDYLIFSDMDETIGGYKIRDSLDNVLETTKLGNPDFELYERQKHCDVDQHTCRSLSGNSNAGWNLDKYKNVHIAEKVHKLRPGYDWYLFIDADTYVLFPGLMRWLATLDPTKPRYLGSTAYIETPFAHGGSGYLVSNALLNKMVATNGLANGLEPQMRANCCGDFVFSIAVSKAAGIEVENMPLTLPFSRNHWCQPLVTMHHLDSEEVSTFWEWEQARYHKAHQDGSSTSPLGPSVIRIRDTYDSFLRPRIEGAPVRTHWDNDAQDRLFLETSRSDRYFSNDDKKKHQLSDPPTPAELAAHTSPEACSAVCAEIEGCFMWRWYDGVCGLSWHFNMGKPVRAPSDTESSKRKVSGWSLEAIDKFRREMDCEEVGWPKSG